MFLSRHAVPDVQADLGQLPDIDPDALLQAQHQAQKQVATAKTHRQTASASSSGFTHLASASSFGRNKDVCTLHHCVPHLHLCMLAYS
jgi:hypothetical protein